MSNVTERYLSAERLGLQVARPVRGRYEIHPPFEPVRSGWVFEYRPGRAFEPEREEWALWDQHGQEVYREPLLGAGRSADVVAEPSRDHLAEVGLLEALVVPWRLGMYFALDGALWEFIDECHGRVLRPAGESMLHVTLDEFERVRQLRAEAADGALLVSWEPTE